MYKKYLNRTDFSSYDDFKNNYSLNIPTDFNFGYDIVDVYADEKPNKKALVWCDDKGGSLELTFRDIKRESNKIANFLVKQGIRKGDVVLLVLKQRYEYWLCAVALHKIGAVLIPGSVQLQKKDIIYRANAAKIKMIISVGDDNLTENIDSAMPESPTVLCRAIVDGTRSGWIGFHDAYKDESDIFDRQKYAAGLKADDIMLIYFTSGTTGMPKMVAHDHTYPLGHITTAKYWQQVREDTLHLTMSDSGWAKFGWGKIYGQWIAGAVIFAYDMDKFVPDKTLRIIEKYKITTFCAPPTMYRFFIKEDLSKYNLSSIKHASIAGEPLNPEVFNQFKKATGLSVHEGFGQSETSVLIGNYEWFAPAPGSTGKPSPLYDIDIVDENGESCPAGVEGEIVVKNLDKYHPAGLLRGYYDNGKIDTSCFEGGVYHTGDAAWRDMEGYYWFVGRLDDVIKCSGYRIGPFEVESAILEHPAVLECAVTAVPDPIRGQIVKATVVLTKKYSPSEELIKEIQEHVKKTTAPYKYPRIVEFSDELPKTIGGKIKRAQIRKSDDK